jgi:hypothetical protein
LNSDKDEVKNSEIKDVKNMKNGIRLSQLNNEQDGPNLNSNKDLRID